MLFLCPPASWTMANQKCVFCGHCAFSFLAFNVAMSGQRPAKLQKLNDFRRKLPQVSHTALAAVCEEIAKEGLPEAHRRKDVKDAVDQELGHWNAYGPLLTTSQVQALDGGTFPLAHINFLSYIHALVKTPGGYSTMFLEKHGANPSSYEQQWELLIYSDEVDPGHLATRDAKKTWGVYVSFKQLGPAMLSKEASWHTILSARSSVVSQASSSLSQVVRLLLESIFGHPQAQPHLSGVVLQCPNGTSFRLWFKIGFMIQDGGAQKFCWSYKGDSATKYCMLCRNNGFTTVTTNLTHQEEDENSSNVVCQLTKLNQLVLCSDVDILHSWDRLTAKKSTCNASDFQLWQQATGLVHGEMALLHSTLLRPLLQPCKQFMHDWMHCCCASGIMNIILFLTFQKLQHDMPIWTEMATYCTFWILPHSLQCCKVQHLFSAKKVESSKAAGRFKCSGAEMLTLLPIVTYFIQTICLPAGIAMLECKAFLQMAKVVELLRQADFGRVHHSTLAQEVDEALACCVKAKWQSHMIRKFHWLLHMSQHVKNHTHLVSCWCMERKHKTISRFVKPKKDPTSFESSVLSEVINQEMFLCKQPNTFLVACGLCQPYKAPLKLRQLVAHLLQIPIPSPQDCQTSLQARCQFGTCAKGDVVLVASPHGLQPWTAAHVWVHFTMGTTSCCIAAAWEFSDYDHTTHVASWRKSEQIFLCNHVDILAPVTYTMSKEVVKTMVPYNLRMTT